MTLRAIHLPNENRPMKTVHTPSFLHSLPLSRLPRIRYGAATW